ncbi:hypothetical protein Ccrd_000577 [Cynara cardunculus var. scolymus]|uniref:Uncharacterized protein n=1 Tax=Cynara cardunculus var. scolymus TaxID=59895 RepID=A0A103XUW4_CYNCS|nr:hypothetical protein Ccrd_000577 [Cynara cardunculus var. scolymus]
MKAYWKWAKQVSETKPPTNTLHCRGKSKRELDDLYTIISQRQSERKMTARCNLFICRR